MSPPTGACALALLAALATDLRTRRIPNALTAATALGALTFHASPLGDGLGAATLGLALGLALLLVPFLLGGMGGGDVKLLGALGAWLGPASIASVFAFGAAAGAALALGLVAAGRARPSAERVVSDAVLLAATRRRQPLRAGPGGLPYSVALAAGFAVWLTVGDLT